MPTTSYTDSTFSVAAVGGRTDSSGASATDYTAEEARFALQVLGEGYLTDGAFAVAAQSSPDMTVKVGSGTAKADFYVVSGDVGGQGKYAVRLDVTSFNVTVPAADASQTRTDEVWLIVHDTTYDASSRGLPRIGYRKGDLGGANPGADTAWKASVLLARITVGAAVTTIVSGNISDQRAASSIALPPVGQVNVGASGSSASFAAVVATTASDILSLRVSGDSTSRFLVRGDKIWWSAGSGSLDTNLYRDSAGVLKTDGALTIDGTLSGAGIGVPQMFLRSSDVTASSTTLQTVITVPITVVGRYLVEGFMHYGAAPGTDMKMAWTYPTSSAGKWSSGGIQSSVGGRVGDLDAGMVDISVALAVSGDSGGPSIEIAAKPVLHLECVNTGNLVFKIAQNTGSGFNTTLRTGSSLRVTRLS